MKKRIILMSIIFGAAMLPIMNNAIYRETIVSAETYNASFSPKFSTEINTVGRDFLLTLDLSDSTDLWRESFVYLCQQLEGKLNNRDRITIYGENVGNFFPLTNETFINKEQFHEFIKTFVRDYSDRINFLLIQKKYNSTGLIKNLKKERKESNPLIVLNFTDSDGGGNVENNYVDFDYSIRNLSPKPVLFLPIVFGAENENDNGKSVFKVPIIPTRLSNYKNALDAVVDQIKKIHKIEPVTINITSDNDINIENIVLNDSEGNALELGNYSLNKNNRFTYQFQPKPNLVYRLNYDVTTAPSTKTTININATQESNVLLNTTNVIKGKVNMSSIVPIPTVDVQKQSFNLNDPKPEDYKKIFTNQENIRNIIPIDDFNTSKVTQEALAKLKVIFKDNSSKIVAVPYEVIQTTSEIGVGTDNPVTSEIGVGTDNPIMSDANVGTDSPTMSDANVGTDNPTMADAKVGNDVPIKNTRKIEYKDNYEISKTDLKDIDYPIDKDIEFTITTDNETNVPQIKAKLISTDSYFIIRYSGKKTDDNKNIFTYLIPKGTEDVLITPLITRTQITETDKDLFDEEKKKQEKTTKNENIEKTDIPVKVNTDTQETSKTLTKDETSKIQETQNTNKKQLPSASFEANDKKQSVDNETIELDNFNIDENLQTNIVNDTKVQRPKNNIQNNNQEVNSNLQNNNIGNQGYSGNENPQNVSENEKALEDKYKGKNPAQKLFTKVKTGDASPLEWLITGSIVSITVVLGFATYKLKKK